MATKVWLRCTASQTAKDSPPTSNRLTSSHLTLRYGNVKQIALSWPVATVFDPRNLDVERNICAKQGQSISVQCSGLSNMKMYLFCMWFKISPTITSFTSSAIVFIVVFFYCFCSRPPRHSPEPGIECLNLDIPINQFFRRGGMWRMLPLAFVDLRLWNMEEHSGHKLLPAQRDYLRQLRLVRKTNKKKTTHINNLGNV